MPTEELDFSKICRVCCCLNGTLLSLFKVHLNRKLMACTNVTIWKDDGLPASICSKCLLKLHIAFQFKKTCEKSDAKLRNILENVMTNKTNIGQEVIQKCLPKAVVKVTKLKCLQQQLLQQHCQNYVCIPSQEANKPIGNEITNLVTTQPVQPYSINSKGMLESLTSNGFSIQHQYETFNVPINHQTNESSSTTVSTSPLQPVVSNDNPLTTITHDQTQANHTTNIKACSTCGKSFSTSAKLSRHTKTHSQRFTHRCNICHKGFTHGGNFKVHMRIHNNEKPFSCTMCDHRCRQLQDLEKHKRRHNGEKPYICRYCSKRFFTSSNLISHERIHRKEKPYVCSICQKAFCQSNELTKHFRTHTKEKSRTCKICQKGFNGSSSLIVHMRTHTSRR